MRGGSYCPVLGFGQIATLDTLSYVRSQNLVSWSLVAFHMLFGQEYPGDMVEIFVLTSVYQRSNGIQDVDIDLATSVHLNKQTRSLEEVMDISRSKPKRGMWGSGRERCAQEYPQSQDLVLGCFATSRSRFICPSAQCCGWTSPPYFSLFLSASPTSLFFHSLSTIHYLASQIDSISHCYSFPRFSIQERINTRKNNTLRYIRFSNFSNNQLTIITSHSFQPSNLRYTLLIPFIVKRAYE